MASERQRTDGALTTIPNTAALPDHVYRVRGLPVEISDDQVTDFISRVLGLESDLPQIRSLAQNLDGRTTVATLSFQKLPVELSGDRHEWSFDIDAPGASNESHGRLHRKIKLTIDDHFVGLTVLSCPPPSDHHVDCLAISGLGCHAFGSFKDRDSAHMWLCDALPYDLTTTRIIIYGYESQLHRSESFQGLEDLAKTLRDPLELLNSTIKPWRINSKGGILPSLALLNQVSYLKQAIIQLHNEKMNGLETLNSIYGALFFGVPNQGMDIRSLIPMTEYQVNQGFLHTLSTESELLQKQCREFPKAFDSPKSRIACFYETLTSPTAIMVNSKWIMDGPRTILVSKASATHSRHWENEAHHIHPIYRDHSRLVKFKPNDEVYDRLCCTLKEFVRDASVVNSGSAIEADELTADDSGFLLWIKGKPGSGKSTLMERIFNENTSHSGIQLGFFFHQRGVQLQKSTIGMLRTISHHLVSQSNSARFVFRKLYNEKKLFGQYGKNWDWNEAELRQVLKTALIEAAKSQDISIIIDALDEAKDEARSIAAYIYEVYEVLQKSASQTRICFSCRNYPIVSLNVGLELYMEDENKNDILAYVNNELAKHIHAHKRPSREDDLKLLQCEISSRASGVFLWIHLIIPIVAKDYNDGKSIDQVLSTLQSAPYNLRSIYEHILKDLIADEGRKDTLHLMQWICLATRPLSVKEIRYALALDDLAIHKSQNSARDSLDFVEDDATMELRITSLSGGLVEVRHHQQLKTVQFMHQSVSDTLFTGGFEWLGLNSRIDVVGQGHHRLARSCVNYLKLGEVQNVGLSYGQSLPLLDYAIAYWFVHAQKAECSGIDQTGLIERFEWPRAGYLDRWIEMSQWSMRSTCPMLKSTLLHISASSNLLGITKKLLLSTSLLEMKDEIGDTPLHCAARFGHYKVVRMLLHEGADAQVKNINGRTALACAAECGHIHAMELLLGVDADENTREDNLREALYYAAEEGSYSGSKVLLDNGANANTQFGMYNNALQAAALNGNEQTVRLLLDCGANVNAQGGELGNALQAAIRNGSKTIVALLLERGANVNAQGGEFGNALQAAAEDGNESLVKLLLDNRAHINFQGSGMYRNTLQAALAGGDELIVKLLLAYGADFSAQGGEFGDALKAAIAGRNDTVLKLLIHHWTQFYEEYRNANQATECCNNQRMVIIHRKANTNTNAIDEGFSSSS
ncbi:hypothetical protein V493_04270 [Pseudogymnoascus sp. VKM F-4281 (FW-2241)]|nr:hypothetical protein V493_04270 [Pseudogymnoascus sp. VKM F-4281 (FW-2241)]